VLYLQFVDEAKKTLDFLIDSKHNILSSLSEIELQKDSIQKKLKKLNKRISELKAYIQLYS
jgi:hypothetical protein